MDKYTIIKLKLKGHSNRAVARMAGINRKTVARYWDEYSGHLEMLNESDVIITQVQEAMVAAPIYDAYWKKRTALCNVRHRGSIFH